MNLPPQSFFKLPLACSRFLDYLWLFLVLAFFNRCCGEGPILSVQGICQVALIDSIFKYGWLYKEKLYLYLFEDELSKLKQVKPDIIVYASWEFYLQVVGFSFLLHKFIAKDVVWEAVSWNNMLKIWIDAFVAYMIFDLSYNTAHLCSHRFPKLNLYRFHKFHHTVRAEITGFNFYAFSKVEHYAYMVAETTAIAVCAAYSPGNFHFLTWLFVKHQAMCNHSANPYTTCLFNPLIDSKFKATIAHNIHHVMSDRNFYEFPWHHIFGYQEDVDLYNKHFATSIRFNVLGL